jgi:ABC-type Mn2+/Zn2+ transport system ATPase subunit
MALVCTFTHPPTYLPILAGVNGAGKTTQLQIVMGRLQPDTGEVVKAKRNMRIAYLAQVGVDGVWGVLWC